MALAFKRSRNDTAVDRSFPNAKETVIFRNDVSNRNLLKNPWRTATEAVGQAGVLNRPARITTDNRGNVFAQSVSLLREGVSNKNLLMNPYNFMVDPDDEKRTLSRQVIMDINNGTAPKYVRENKGIDEIAFTILQLLPDNGVKLATISMLKSYITGRRLLAVLDQGGQKITRSFDVFNQLISSSKNLYKNGELGLKVPSLLLKYSESMKEIFGDAVLQDVMPQTIYAAIQDLSTVSTVLSKLFRSENMISPSTNLSIDQWSAIENSRLQKIKEIEQARQAQIIKIGEPVMPVRAEGESKEVFAAKLNKYYNDLSEYAAQGTTSQEPTAAALPGSRRSGDNYPTGTQGVLDPNNIKQEGGKRKKKKILKVVGGYRASSQQTQGLNPSTGSSENNGKTDTNINTRPNTQPPIQIDTSNSPNTSSKVNTQPPIQVEITNQLSSSRTVDYVISGLTGLASLGAVAYTVYSNEQSRKRENKAENDQIELNTALSQKYPLLDKYKKRIFDFVLSNMSNLTPNTLFDAGFDDVDVFQILSQSSIPGKQLALLNKLIDYQNINKEVKLELVTQERRRREREEEKQQEEQQRQAKMQERRARRDPVLGLDVEQVEAGIGRGRGKKNKKKSLNLDAQILALLKS